MQCWVAKDENGQIFAYENEPVLDEGIWQGNVIVFMSDFKFSDTVIDLFNKQKAVHVDLKVIPISFEIINN